MHKPDPYHQAFIDAEATVYDLIEMEIALVHATRLSRRPTRAQRLERWLWRCLAGAFLLGGCLALWL